MNISMIQESLINLFPIYHSVNYYIFYPKKLNFCEFSHIEVWFTNQNSKRLGVEDETNITVVIP